VVLYNKSSDHENIGDSQKWPSFLLHPIGLVGKGVEF